jgi:hypothetical protein
VEYRANSWLSCNRVKIALYAKYQTESNSCGILARSTAVIKGTEELGGMIVRAVLESRKDCWSLSYGLAYVCDYLG